MAQNQKPLIYTATVQMPPAYVPTSPQRIFIRVQDTNLFVASGGNMPDSADIAVTWNVRVPVSFSLRSVAVHKYMRREINERGLVAYLGCMAIESHTRLPNSSDGVIELNGYNLRVNCNYKSKSEMRFVQIDLLARSGHVALRDEAMNRMCIPPSLLKLESWSCRTNVEAYELPVCKSQD